ncbi:MAG: rod shape-determining protein MreC [Polyangia bacterium]|jgi:rod shape-determining protein MreC|nr:rod shape-determining protein MreC [Polyangia bacterium]
MTSHKIRDAVIGVVLLALVGLFFNSNLKEEDELNAVDRVVLTVSAPLERAFVAVFATWMGVYKKYLVQKDLKAENEELRRRNAALAAHNSYLASQARRGRQLQRFAAFMEDSSAEMLPANVVRRRIDTERFRVMGVVMDRRWPDVECGAPVITPEGVVGRVLYFELSDGDRIPCPVEQNRRRRPWRRKLESGSVAIGRAMVQLTVDPESRVDVRVPRTGARGMLRGMGWDHGFVARIADLDPKAQVSAGDLVVTTGVDGRFPPGLPVGRIFSSAPREGREPLTLVRPVVEFGKLTRVLVVVSPPPPEVPTVARKRAPRLGLVPYP